MLIENVSKIRKPSGRIRLAIDWTLLDPGYFGELAVRNGFDYGAGWDRFSKYGKWWTWMDPTQVPLLLSSSGIHKEGTQCWDYYNRFHPDWFALTGSATAPTMKMRLDRDQSYSINLSVRRIHVLRSRDREKE